MKTVYYTATTLDGYIATEDHSLDWLMQFGEDDPTYTEFRARIGAMAMGRNTYQFILNEHRAKHQNQPFEWPYTLPTFLFTSSGVEMPATGDVRLVKGDVRPVHAAMVAAAGGLDVWLVGGGDLVGQFHDHGLLDEIVATVAPVTLGAGKPLLPRRIQSPPLDLKSVRQVGPFAQLTYTVPPR